MTWQEIDVWLPLAGCGVAVVGLLIYLILTRTRSGSQPRSSEQLEEEHRQQDRYRRDPLRDRDAYGNDIRGPSS